MGDPNQERRKYARIDIVARIVFRIKGQEFIGTSESVQAIAKNVNVEGICFRSDKNLELGTVLDLEIYVAEETVPLRMEGEVRWTKSVLSASGKTVYDIGIYLYTFKQSEVARFIGYVCDVMMARLNRHLKR